MHMAGRRTADPGGALLSVTMPTRNRPELFERALRSVLGDPGRRSGRVSRVRRLGRRHHRRGRPRLLTAWPGRHRYVWNRPPLPLVENLNRAIEISTGEWVMQLHDDDYLLPEPGGR